MSNYFEIDFLDVESKKSGDAIAIRYVVDGLSTIHVVDGGFQDTGDKVVGHINTHYGNPSKIDRVVVTHPDGDHAGGLRKVLESFEISELWMLRPWVYAGEIIDRFSRFTSVENLEKRLKEIYPNIAALEAIAEENGIRILEPFQGARIGGFIVLAPSKDRYLDLIVESERTPESSKKEEQSANAFKEFYEAAKAAAVALIKAAWGEENFSSEETSSENEMSVVQYARIHDKRILLTGDAGRSALSEAAAFAPYAGLSLPGIDKFQVPHHGSRRNLSTDILDQWLGSRLSENPGDKRSFTAIISAAKADEHHPRNAVVRAMIHRGASVISTEGKNICTGYNAPDREGWVPVSPLQYPDDQEE